MTFVTRTASFDSNIVVSFTKVARVRRLYFLPPTRFLNRTESNLKGRSLVRAVFGTTMKSSSRRMKTMEAATTTIMTQREKEA